MIHFPFHDFKMLHFKSLNTNFTNNSSLTKFLPRHRNSVPDSARNSVAPFPRASNDEGRRRERRRSADRASPGDVARSRPSEVAAIKKVRGTVVLMKKNVLDFNDVNASVMDRVHELLGRRVMLRLVSSVHGDSANGRLSKPAYLEDWITTITPLTAGDSAYQVGFDWDAHEFGFPGAFIVRNEHHNEFYLKSLTLEGVPGHGRVHFVCNSWVYPADKYRSDRVFFTNKAYLPSDTPEFLRKYREDELASLRGNGTGELREWDRVYDYAYYNDLGTPDKGEKYARPVLGGSKEYPYPRRGRTGRPSTKTDPRVEKRLPLVLSLNIYAPRDERFGHLKLSDFLAYALKSIGQFLKPELADLLDRTPNEFDSFEDVLKLYEGGFEVPEALLKTVRDNVPAEILREMFRSDGERLLKFPVPQVIKEDKNAWSTDEEFTREMLAGINPVMICRLQEFPPTSKLDRSVYGDHTSKIAEEDIKHGLIGLSIEEAIEENKLFIVDHHDALMPFLRRINLTATKTYACRTLLFLQEDGTLRPLAIELSLPHPKGEKFGCVGKVYTPASEGVEGWTWRIAKAYVAVNDSGYHQLVSHWLHTHAVMEPFVIATNRHMSTMHPIHKLLRPHFRDTMNLNAVARQTLINAGGALEVTVFPGKYSLELTSASYKNWSFPEQALPNDLIKRGMAFKDENSPLGLRLVIEDYPYAVDGLEIWSAIRAWVSDYVSIYYKSDQAVQSDTELQSWWKEVREVGHGDLRDEAWWPRLESVEELIETCSTVVWIASALHAAINFGQYPYGGFPPNRPSMSRRLMPEIEELRREPEKAFLRTITGQVLSVLGISLVEVLSRHSSDEVYLGQRDAADSEWTNDADVAAAFAAFGASLRAVEAGIERRNADAKLKNRAGPAKMPYTLLYPSSEGGLTGKGIPNSVSI